MNRRNFLRVVGSAGVIVAAAGAGFAATRRPMGALEPWQDAASLYPDPLRRALSYAVLAPNPHNRQPWIVELRSGTEARLFCDLGRLLPATDPFSRQIVIGLGCFLELFSLAAAAQGHHASIEYFPEGESRSALDQRPIALLSLDRQDGLVADPLFSRVLQRHTNRNPYDTTREISDALLGGLRDAAADTVHVGTVNRGEPLEELRALIRDAMVAEMRTPNAYQESVDLMRIGRAEIEANPDGIALGGAFLETLNLVGVLTPETLADPASSAFQIGLDMIVEGAMTAMGFVWINTPGNNRRAQIEAGRAYMRIALQAAGSDLAMQPMSQSLQEYAAMAPFYDAVHQRLARQAGQRVQMLARVGFAEPAGPAPRWPLAARMKEG